MRKSLTINNALVVPVVFIEQFICDLAVKKQSKNIIGGRGISFVLAIILMYKCSIKPLCRSFALSDIGFLDSFNFIRKTINTKG